MTCRRTTCTIGHQSCHRRALIKCVPNAVRFTYVCVQSTGPIWHVHKFQYFPDHFSVFRNLWRIAFGHSSPVAGMCRSCLRCTARVSVECCSFISLACLPTLNCARFKRPPAAFFRFVCFAQCSPDIIAEPRGRTHGRMHSHARAGTASTCAACICARGREREIYSPVLAPPRLKRRRRRWSDLSAEDKSDAQNAAHFPPLTNGHRKRTAHAKKRTHVHNCEPHARTRARAHTIGRFCVHPMGAVFIFPHILSGISR